METENIRLGGALSNLVYLGIVLMTARGLNKVSSRGHFQSSAF